MTDLARDYARGQLLWLKFWRQVASIERAHRRLSETLQMIEWGQQRLAEKLERVETEI
jgi:hypothetical protein